MCHIGFFFHTLQFSPIFLGTEVFNKVNLSIIICIFLTVKYNKNSIFNPSFCNDAF